MYFHVCVCMCVHTGVHAPRCVRIGVFYWRQPTPRRAPLTPTPWFSPCRAGQDGGGRGERAAGEMATGADVRDILELGGVESENTGTINKKDIINSDKVKRDALTAAARLLGAGWPCVWWVFEERWKKARSCHILFIFRLSRYTKKCL